jgi:hypothetical protein
MSLTGQPTASGLTFQQHWDCISAIAQQIRNIRTQLQTATSSQQVELMATFQMLETQQHHHHREMEMLKQYHPTSTSATPVAMNADLLLQQQQQLHQQLQLQQFQRLQNAQQQQMLVQNLSQLTSQTSLHALQQQQQQQQQEQQQQSDSSQQSLTNTLAQPLQVCSS